MLLNRQGKEKNENEDYEKKRKLVESLERMEVYIGRTRSSERSHGRLNKVLSCESRRYPKIDDPG